MNEHEDSTTSATRRRLLTGGAAVVGSAAGAVLLGATNAQAADGNAILAGRANTATAATTLTNSSTSGGAHGLLISTKGGYGFQATSASNHGLAGITANATKAGVLATNNGPRGTGAALIANGRNNVGASVYNHLTPAPALVAKATGEDDMNGVDATAIRAVVSGWGATAVDAESTGGTAVVGRSIVHSTDTEAVGAFFDAFQMISTFNATGMIVNAAVLDQDGIPQPARAILAIGDVDVEGNLTKASGSFRIDHPLDPANKYLYHSFVESPDMANVYNGTVKVDAKGEAVVELPEWFDALNKDFRYQLTPIGGPAPDLHVKKEIEGNTFTVAGAKANQKISWQVVGTRQDAWANEHRIPVEQNKPKKERGTYLFPRGFGQPETKRLNYRDPNKIKSHSGE